MGDKFFQTRFNKADNPEEFYDFSIWVNGKEFRVHRVVFAAHSSFFARVFQSQAKEFVIDDVKESIFEEIMSFVYTGHADINASNEVDLLVAARHYEIKGLVQSVELYRNIRGDPLIGTELEALRHKYEEAKYLFEKARERYSLRNPFNQTPARYY